VTVICKLVDVSATADAFCGTISIRC